ncbi:restriction endonuclease [Glycomyces sp. NPDC046736]|uniref:nSTAND1 domain-containing NTPase n=1 Tax=Glycomyces sp. NPDC046736 TaxID=3155615 RepID=UPI0033EB46AA
MDQIGLETTDVVVLADGSSVSDISNKRGHLFEAFIAKLLATQGYNDPHPERVNLTKEGIELDVEARHSVTGDRIICECKAYSSNIPAHMLNAFLGKFAIGRSDDPRLHGLFIGIPRLTQSAREQAELAQEKLSGFRYLGSYEISKLLESAGVLPRLDEGPKLKSDPTIVITEHGVVMAACELDPETRHARRWVTWSRQNPVPSPINRLVERELAKGLPVISVGEQNAIVPVRLPDPPNIVEVQGSSSDFEYQLPAAPAFFVGRKSISEELLATITGRKVAGSIVINAKSGWGKSSLTLRLQQGVAKAGGVAIVIDTRTAERPSFVAAAVERAIKLAVSKDMVKLPESAAFTSLQSLVETLRISEWKNPSKPILIAFDQFENVFRSSDLTREFRDLSYLVRELSVPLTISFSWKTDLVSFTEGHPFHFRDEIRDAAQVVILDPFGSREVETLLRRLEKSLDEKLHRDLRQRLKEYSQGLPWLFKKLAGHVLAEVGRGVSQDELARQALNVHSLFESDLARLSPAEQAALRAIAQAAPIGVADLDESVASSALLESLLHQRLVVQVGDRIDIYWDTFRDFLNTGRVAIEDSYVVRYATTGAGRLLQEVVSVGGNISVAELANSLNTSPTVVFNYARELRMFGVLNAEVNRVVIESTIQNSDNVEEAVRAQVLQALRRHKLYRLLSTMLSQEDIVLLQRFADVLPGEFPTVEAKSDSWFTYARAFCQWMDYAGLIRLRRDGIDRPLDENDEPLPKLLSGVGPVRVRSAFPGGLPGASLQLLLHLSDSSNFARPSARGFKSAVRDLSLLGVVERDSEDRILLSDRSLVADGVIVTQRLRSIVERQPNMRTIFKYLEADPGASLAVIGELHRTSVGADWAQSTTIGMGKFIRAWARACGIETKTRPSNQD